MAFRKDPAAVLDYAFDWGTTADGHDRPWLNEDETITAHTVTVDPGLTKGATSVDGGRVTVWLSGGTTGTNYKVTCAVTTNQGRTDERTIRIDVRDR